MTGSPPAEIFASRLLGWFDVHGRQDLPWQKRRTPYRVWISEIMLQQTQVTTVIPYYRQFMRRFASVRALAEAPLDEVLHLWSGLGYYSRARNLHRAAQMIVQQHAGRFPREFADVAALPGIGRSTAGAILALAFDQRHPILDGNVRRVLARVHEVDGDPSRRDVETRLWSLADAGTPHKRVADYTQAIMDLGATVCTRSKPDCASCPVQSMCGAFRHGTQADFPGKRARRDKPVREIRMLLIVTPAGEVLLERRPPTGIWGGLWSFPEISVDQDSADWCAARLACSKTGRECWDVHRHTFTHFHLDITPEVIRLQTSVDVVASAAADPAVYAAAHSATRVAGDPAPSAVADADTVWYKLDSPAALGLAAPVRRLLDRLQSESATRTHAGDANRTGQRQ